MSARAKARQGAFGAHALRVRGADILTSLVGIGNKIRSNEKQYRISKTCLFYHACSPTLHGFFYYKVM